jgi:hypothetical protein
MIAIAALVAGACPERLQGRGKASREHRSDDFAKPVGQRFRQLAINERLVR